MEMVAVGLDLSLCATGLVSLLAGTGTTLYSDEIKSNSRDSDGMVRVIDLAERIRVMVSAQGPELVAVEGYAFGAKGDSLTRLVELGTLVRYHLIVDRVPYIEVAPTTLKKFVTGKGNAPKDLMLKECYKKWNFDTSSNNVADAFALAKYAEATLIERGRLTNAR